MSRNALHVVATHVAKAPVALRQLHMDDDLLAYLQSAFTVRRYRYRERETGGEILYVAVRGQ